MVDPQFAMLILLAVVRGRSIGEGELGGGVLLSKQL